MAQPKAHHFQTSVRWTGASTGEISTHGLPPIFFGPPVDFGGSGEEWTPELMLVGAAEACTLLTFLAYARRRGIQLVSYSSSANATLSRDEDGAFRFTEIVLRPAVRVQSEADAEKARALLDNIKELCFIGASLRHEPRVQYTVEVAPPSSGAAAG
jgi:peroxiredoxin-like protein